MEYCFEDYLEPDSMDIIEHKVSAVDDIVKLMNFQDFTGIKNETEVASQSSCNSPHNFKYQDGVDGQYIKIEAASQAEFKYQKHEMKIVNDIRQQDQDEAQVQLMPQDDLMRYSYQVETQGVLINNQEASQEYLMPQDLMSYNCQVSPQGQCIRDQEAPQAYFMTQDGQIQLFYQEYLPSSPPAKECCGCEKCQISLCKYSHWPARKDAQVQADRFESGVHVLCIRCGDVIQDRSSCQERYNDPTYECNRCVLFTNRAVMGPLVTGHNTAANTGAVLCCYCRKRFQTIRGMRIHQGRIHKRAKPNH